MKARYLFLHLLICILGATTLYAQTAQQQQLLPAQQKYSLRYFADPDSRYTINQVSSPAFADSFLLASRQYPNFGFVSGNYWFSILMPHSFDTTERTYFEVAYPPLDSVYFYYKNQDGFWQTRASGDVLPFHTRDLSYVNHLFTIPQQANGAQTYFFRLNTKGAYTFPLAVKKASTLRKEIPLHYFKYGFYYGALLLMLLYNLFLYFGLRLKPYLFYCLYLFFSIISQSYLYGHAQLFIGSAAGQANNLFSSLTLYLSIGFALLFTINFVSTRQTVPLIHKILKCFAFTIFGICILTVISSSQLFFSLIPPFYIITVLLIIIAAAAAWYKGQTIARLFLLAWLVYLVSLVAYSFQSMGLWGQLESSVNLVMAGSMIEVLLLSLALADRIRQYKKERRKANEMLLLASKEQQELLEHQHQVLEMRVSERTIKLQEKQKEVIRQNRKLFDQQQLIEAQNQQLSLLNENLEKIVGARTGELRKANLSLHKRNQQLEQFAYIISHNLRGPVASIIGLVKLVDRKNLGTAENLQYMELLDQSITKLDTVIADLGHVLTLEQSMDKHFRDLDLAAVVDGIFQKLHLQVQEAKPYLEIDLQVDKVFSHPAYLESVLYNLISNAIKYRSPDKQLKLKICSWQQQEQFYLSVNDNGLGLDLEQHGKKLFMLYQRFHVEKEGRGLGLYMVKRQLESMGGSIQVASRPGEGSTFTLSMPLHRELMLENM